MLKKHPIVLKCIEISPISAMAPYLSFPVAKTKTQKISWSVRITHAGLCWVVKGGGITLMV